MQEITFTPVQLKVAFNNPTMPDGLVLPGCAQPSWLTPIKKISYVWDKIRLQLMIAFFISGDRSMRLYGHTGTGKTSIVEQFHSWLNLPLYMVSAHKHMELQDLYGQYVLEDGKTVFKYGPLLLAAQSGMSVLIDEFNTLQPGVMTGLNALLEGSSIYIAQTGEVITPKAGFRVFATGNVDRGEGVYHDRNEQDAANNERWWHVNVEYLKPEEEIPLIKTVLVEAKVPDDVAGKLAESMVDVANGVRSLFVGSNDDSNAIEVTMSTRTLLNWAKKSVLFKSMEAQHGESTYHIALRYCLTNAPMEDRTRTVIHQLAADKLGFESKEMKAAKAAGA